MLSESCSSSGVSQNRDRKNAPNFAVKTENENRAKPHQDYVGASVDETGLRRYMFTYTARETGEAGLMYYRARYYNPSIGRFTAEDPLSNAIPDNGYFDKYNYILNSPVMGTDPSGLYPFFPPEPITYKIDKSCDCPVPGTPGSGGPPPSMRNAIKFETYFWCAFKMGTITNPKRKQCLQSRCRNGTVKCKDDCKPDRIGQAMKKIWILPAFSKTATVCTNTWPSSGPPPGEIGKTVVHEWAHTCGWDHGMGEGVPE